MNRKQIDALLVCPLETRTVCTLRCAKVQKDRMFCTLRNVFCVSSGRTELSSDLWSFESCCVHIYYAQREALLAVNWVFFPIAIDVFNWNVWNCKYATLHLLLFSKGSSPLIDIVQFVHNTSRILIQSVFICHMFLHKG